MLKYVIQPCSRLACLKQFSQQHLYYLKRYTNSSTQKLHNFSLPLPSFMAERYKDIGPNVFSHRFAHELNVHYLSKVRKDQVIPQNVKGKIVCPDCRGVASLIVERKGIRRNVIFILDTGCDFTYMTQECFDEMEVGHGYAQFKINGKPELVYQSFADSRPYHVNILGTHYLSTLKCISIETINKEFTIYF